MSQDNEKRDDEGRPRESYPNPTQRRMDEDGQSESDAPVDASWDEGRWGETEPPHEEQEPGTLREPDQGEAGEDLV